MNRRKFIVASSLLATTTAFSQIIPIKDSLKSETTINPLNIKSNEDKLPTVKTLENNKPFYPNSLMLGSKVAIVSPSSITNTWELSRTLKYFKNLGLEVELGKTITKQTNKYGYLAAPDEERADEFNSFLQRDDIDAIIASRGGYGAIRIIDKIDFEVLKTKPKILLGFSDFTLILNAASKISNIVTFHGPVGISSFTNFTRNYFQKLLYNSNNQPVVIKNDDIQILNEGVAQGKLVGGNLTMLTSCLGSPYEIETDGAILFIEDTNEQSYQVDRMLSQLRIAGKFKNLKGIILGEFANLRKKRPFYPNYSNTMMEVFEQILKPLKVPIVINFPIGHISDQVTLPILSEASLDTSKKTLTIFKGVS
jgi:muramoyltetrapeptide carboxypeptidase